MDLILNILVALGLVPAKDLSDSMGQSRTLTIMVGILLAGKAHLKSPYVKRYMPQGIRSFR